MERSLVVAVALVLAACGGSRSLAGGRSPEPPSPAKPRLASAEGAAPNMGAGEPSAGEGDPRRLLERPEALQRFFAALVAVEDGHATDDVRVLHFGDSHTAADMGTSATRRVLQARFGDGGRGFVALGRPWSSYYQEGLRGGMSRDFHGERGAYKAGRFMGDGRYGLAGFAVQTERRGVAWSDLRAPSSGIELAYLEQPRGGSFDVVIDGALAGTVSTRAASARSGFRAFAVDEGPHRIEARTKGNGAVRIFGVALDRAKAGVVYEALGINGARAQVLLRWDEAHLTEQLAHRAPTLVVLAYGTNESGDEQPMAAYEQQLVEALGRIARAAPSASCLLLGPPDRALKTAGAWRTSARLLAIVESQRKVAEAAGCAFFDQLEAMGGPGSMVRWASEAKPRARRDYVHLTREGYVELGEALGNELLRAYAAWRAEQAGPPRVARAESE